MEPASGFMVTMRFLLGIGGYKQYGFWFGQPAFKLQTPQEVLTLVSKVTNVDQDFSGRSAASAMPHYQSERNVLQVFSLRLGCELASMSAD